MTKPMRVLLADDRALFRAGKLGGTNVSYAEATKLRRGGPRRPSFPDPAHSIPWDARGKADKWSSTRQESVGSDQEIRRYLTCSQGLTRKT